MLASEDPAAFVTNAEVLQELFHRYHAGGRWADGRRVLERFVDVMRGRIEPVFAEDVVQAAHLAPLYLALDARDLVHVAVMQRLGVSQIVSADRGFDRIEGIERLDPAKVDDWAGSVGR